MNVSTICQENLLWLNTYWQPRFPKWTCFFSVYVTVQLMYI